MLQLNIVGVGWFCIWAGGDEVVGEPAIAGIPIDISGDEVDGFLRNDVGAGHGDLLQIGGRSEDAGFDDVGMHACGLALCWQAEANMCHDGSIPVWSGQCLLFNDAGVCPWDSI